MIPDFRIGSHAPATRFKLISRADLRALSKQHKPSDLPFATPPQPGSLRRLLYNSATSILRSSPSTINFWSIISVCDQSNSSRASKSLALDTYLIHPSQPLDRRPSDRLYRMKWYMWGRVPFECCSHVGNEYWSPDTAAEFSRLWYGSLRLHYQFRRSTSGKKC